LPRLQVLNGKRQGATFDIGRGGAVVGHRNTAPISIDDPWVSWDHARVFLQSDAYWIEDLGSTNGTFVNCVRVKRERLNHEDIVFFGKTHVIFLVPETASASADAPGAASDEKKRSSFEINVEAVAAAAQWTAPTSPNAVPALNKNGKNGAPPSQSAAPALPVRPEERAPLGAAPATGLEPGEESSRARDPFRPGADPWENRPPAPTRGSSALANLDPDSDPFASARADQGRGADPFTVGADPFEGPRARSFVETQHDRDGAPPSSSSNRPTSEDGNVPKKKPGFEGFDIDEKEPDPLTVAPVSAAEVSSLLEPRRSNDGDEPGLDDLDALLGDGAARTPDPGIIKVPQPRRPSEALTRPVDTVASNEAAQERARGTSARYPSPVAPMPPPQPRSGTGRLPPVPADTVLSPASGARTQPLAAQNPPSSSDGARVEAELAFEVAKLKEQVRRLHMALEASKQGDPEKVRVAVEALRSDDLVRQAREITELKRDLAALEVKHAKTQAELDDVTADMIAKEDTIDALKSKLGDVGGRSPAPGGADELRTLEF